VLVCRKTVSQSINQSINTIIDLVPNGHNKHIVTEVVFSIVLVMAKQGAGCVLIYFRLLEVLLLT